MLRGILVRERDRERDSERESARKRMRADVCMYLTWREICMHHSSYISAVVSSLLRFGGPAGIHWHRGISGIEMSLYACSNHVCTSTPPEACMCDVSLVDLKSIEESISVSGRLPAKER